MNLEQLLKFAADQGASDIHLQAGWPPKIRIAGLIRNVEGPPLEAGALHAFLKTLLPADHAGDIESALRQAALFSQTIEGVGRFRCGLYRQLGAPGAALRLIPSEVPTLEALNLPPVLRDMALSRHGLTLITGTAGSGKTSTVAALVDLLNSAHHVKITTLESPVEVLHSQKKAFLSQLEVGRDVEGLDQSIARISRLDPDVIVVDELIDGPSIVQVLRAVQSGRQVIATMLATTPTQAIERIYHLAGPMEQGLVTAVLAMSLEGITSQRLAQTKDGKRRPAIEVLRGGPVTAKSLLERRLGDLKNLPAGRQGGMQKIEQHLVALHQAGVISGTEAMRLANEPDQVAPHIRSAKAASA
jgi:pilus retraction protein PilT